MKQDEINAVKKAAEKMRKQESAQDEIIRFAIQCRLVTTGNRDGLYMDALTEFANLVAAKEQKKWQDQTAVEIHEAVLEEREACAKLCENMSLEWEDQPTIARVELATMMDCALAIRARGEA
jgi:hypothetical protein